MALSTTLALAERRRCRARSAHLGVRLGYKLDPCGARRSVVVIGYLGRTPLINSGTSGFAVASASRPPVVTICEVAAMLSAPVNATAAMSASSTTSSPLAWPSSTSARRGPTTARRTFSVTDPTEPSSATTPGQRGPSRRPAPSARACRSRRTARRRRGPRSSSRASPGGCRRAWRTPRSTPGTRGRAGGALLPPAAWWPGPRARPSRRLHSSRNFGLDKSLNPGIDSSLRSRRIPRPSYRGCEMKEAPERRANHDGRTETRSATTSVEPRSWWVLAVMSVGTLMVFLDDTVVNTALPRIAVDLHASTSALQWVIDAFVLVL